jgi:glycosyltransferase involved in cell wall biosynthesis
MKTRQRLLRITTVPISLKILLKGQLEFMQQNGFDVLTVSADGPEIGYLKQQGIDHQIVNMTRKITPIQDLKALIHLIRIIRAFKPDIVHTHTPKAGLLGMMAAWICRVNVRLHTVAGLPLMEARGLKKRVLMFTEKITCACANKVYPNSKAMAEYILKHIYPVPEKVSVIGEGSSNGIDTDFFNPSDELRVAAVALREQYNISDQLIFSFVGRVVTDKGVNELLRAFDRLSKEHPCWLLLVGPFEDDLDPISNESLDILKSNNRIISLGYVNEVRTPMLASDVFVFPSYREGFPNVVMQACCLERPCIVTNINGCNEIIQHGTTGLIVPAKDEIKLYEAMRFMTINRDRRREFGAASRRYVVANFNQAYLWDTILNEYKKQLTLVR